MIYTVDATGYVYTVLTIAVELNLTQMVCNVKLSLPVLINAPQQSHIPFIFLLQGISRHEKVCIYISKFLSFSRNTILVCFIY